MNIDKIINDLSRQFREYREKATGLVDVSAKKAEHYLGENIKAFWREQPWYVRIIRKPIMQYAYKMWKRINSL